MRASVPWTIVVAVVVFGGRVQDIKAHPAGSAETEAGAYKAADYQIVDTYEFPGFRLVQFTLPALSHYSYILASDGKALVVDPGRDASVYLKFLQEHELAAEGVFLTHTHADFVAGHTELAHELKCTIYKSAEGGAKFTYEPLKDNDKIIVGKAHIRFVETPGHTPDSMCGFVSGSGRAGATQAILTGDTLFVGSMGRPDLLEGYVTAASLASMAYDSWHKKLSKAADEAIILPAHGAGSLCGAHLGDEPYSTIGQEKRSNPYLQLKSRSEFIAAVLDELPQVPQYFAHNAAMNRRGPDLIDWSAPLPKEVAPSAALTEPDKHWVVDIRSTADYAAGHIPNSINIAVRGKIETWVGTMVPWEANLVLCGPKEDLTKAVHRLHRVGYKAGVITFESYKSSGLPLARGKVFEPRELHEQMKSGKAPMIVDVRRPSELESLRIGTAVNLPLTQLSRLSAKLDPSMPVTTLCRSSYRSSIAMGILERAGIQSIGTVAGGAKAWVDAGLPVHTADHAVGSVAADRHVLDLPARISAEELRRLQLDLPGTFELIDIRPAQLFADYHIPGSTNVRIAEVLRNPAHLRGATPLIIADRDGSVAMMVAAILSQKTDRPIKALYGGVEAYWGAADIGSVGRSPVPLSGDTDGHDRARHKPVEPPAKAKPAKPKKPKARSAGC